MHALVIDDTGGAHGVRDLSLLQSIAYKPQSRFGGKELYKGPFEKAAVLLEAVANYHVFIDGNKRTALVAAARFLSINGYEFTASNKAAEKTILAVATKEISMGKLQVWLQKNAKKLPKR